MRRMKKKKATLRKVLYKEMLTVRNYFVGRLLLSWQSHLKLISRRRQYIYTVFCCCRCGRVWHHRYCQAREKKKTPVKLNFTIIIPKEKHFGHCISFLSLIKFIHFSPSAFHIHAMLCIPFYTCKIGFV